MFFVKSRKRYSLEEVPPACQGPGQAGGWIMLAKEMGIVLEGQFFS
jgi:hypothetical protein